MNQLKIQQNTLMSVDEVKNLIREGRSLVLSGEEELLSQLPQGKWIGGTIPYFYLEGENGRMDKTMIFVTDFSDSVSQIAIKTYEENELSNIASNSFDNGFNFLILPALGDIHMSFAMHSHEYPGLYNNPLIGLIAGVDLNELSQGKLSKTFNGQTGNAYTDKGVALHAELSTDKVARLEIFNLFTPGGGPVIEVESDGYIISDCLIDGEKKSLYDFVKDNNIDIKNPLTADYNGAIANVSFQALDDEKKEVALYAPLFKGQKYTLAAPVGNYAKTFKSKIGEALKDESSILYNCNCILNYLYGELDKNEIGFSGPATFGEIAYTLLNQTFTYLAIDEY